MKFLRIFLLLLLVLPLPALVWLSFWFPNSFPSFPGEPESLAWQGMFSSDRGWLSALPLSLSLSTLCALICTALGFGVSRFIALHPKRRNLVIAAYFPYLLSPVIFAFLLRFWFSLFGLSGTFVSVFIAQICMIFPYNIILFDAFWNERTLAMDSQSATLGATFLQRMRYVLIPMAKPWIALALFQSFLISWFEYGLSATIGLGKVKTLTILTYGFIQEANPAFAAVSALALTIPPLLVLVLNRSLLKPVVI
jgi:putative spermidine/putrescine transport system permease protein